MTGPAGDGIVDGKPGLIKQGPTQFEARFGDRIFGEIIHWLREMSGLFKAKRLIGHRCFGLVGTGLQSDKQKQEPQNAAPVFTF